MLKDAIEATKEKLVTLKTAAQQANEQLANGEITQQIIASFGYVPAIRHLLQHSWRFHVLRNHEGKKASVKE